MQHTWVRSETLHIAAVFGNSKLHSGRLGTTGISRSRQGAGVLLVQHGDVEIRRIGVIQSANNHLGLSYQI